MSSMIKDSVFPVPVTVWPAQLPIHHTVLLVMVMLSWLLMEIVLPVTFHPAARLVVLAILLNVLHVLQDWLWVHKILAPLHVPQTVCSALTPLTAQFATVVSLPWAMEHVCPVLLTAEAAPVYPLRPASIVELVFMLLSIKPAMLVLRIVWHALLQAPMSLAHLVLMDTLLQLVEAASKLVHSHVLPVHQILLHIVWHVYWDIYPQVPLVVKTTLHATALILVRLAL